MGPSPFNQWVGAKRRILRYLWQPSDPSLNREFDDRWGRNHIGEGHHHTWIGRVYTSIKESVEDKIANYEDPQDHEPSDITTESNTTTSTLTRTANIMIEPTSTSETSKLFYCLFLYTCNHD